LTALADATVSSPKYLRHIVTSICAFALDYSIGYRRTIVKGTIVSGSLVEMTCPAVGLERWVRENSYELDGGGSIYDTIFAGTIIDGTYSFEKPGLVVCHGLS
jgi:hypothetical protein